MLLKLRAIKIVINHYKNNWTRKSRRQTTVYGARKMNILRGGVCISQLKRYARYWSRYYDFLGDLAAVIETKENAV